MALLDHVTVSSANLRLDVSARRTGWRDGVMALWPGLLLTAGIAALAFALRCLPLVATFSPMILAILIGIVVRNGLGVVTGTAAGIAFALRRILRLAIILLGLQLTAAQVAEVGVAGVSVIVATLLATFLFTVWLGRRLGVDRRLAALIAAGTSICGASAVIAVNTVTGADDADVAYAVACVTLFGTLAMFAYPLLPGVLHLGPQSFGLWAGASIHEVAQVVAAGFQDGKQAGDFATIAKLSRVMMLAPMVIALGLAARSPCRGQVRGEETRGLPAGKAPLPWFVLGFVALVGVNSVVTVPADAKAVVVVVTTFLLTMALAAMGLSTDIAKLRARGLRPFLLGLTASLFIASFGLVLVKAIA